MSQIVVRLPDKLDELVCSFPFLENLRHFYEVHEIHLIVDKDLAPYLVLLPFNAFIHNFDKVQYPGALDVPRFVAHQESIHDVSKFYSLTDSKIDAAFGKAFNAKEKIGFKFGLTANFLFDKKIAIDENLHPMTKYLRLMEGNIKKDGQYFSRELESLVQDLYQPYVVLNIGFDEDKLVLDPKWCDYIDYYMKYTIFIMCEKAPKQEKMKELVSRYRINAGRENRLMFFENDNPLKLSQLLYHAKGFVSDTTDISFLASYMGVPVIEFTDKEVTPSPLSKSYLAKERGDFEAASLYDQSHSMFML